MSMLKRVLTGSALSVIALFANIAVAMFMMPFIIHALGDHDYGLWVLVASFIGYYGLLDFGMSVAVTRFISRADGQGNVEEMNVILNTSSAFFATLGIIVFLISCTVAWFVPTFVENNVFVVQMLWLTVGITSIFQFGLRGFYGVLFAKIRQDIMSYTTLAKIFIRMSLILYFLSNGYGVMALAIISMVTELLTYAIDMIILRKIYPEMKISWKLVKMSRIKALIRYGIFSMVNQISDLMRLRALPVIVTYATNITYIVFFSIAIRLMEIYYQVLEKVIHILTPVFSKYEGADNTDGITKMFWIAFRVNLAISILVGFGIMFFGNSFISWWIGPEYVLASDLTIWLGVGFLAYTTQQTGKTALFGISKHERYAVISAIESTAGAALGAVLGTLYGPLWIAVGVATSMIVFEILVKPFVVAEALAISLKTYYLTMIEVFIKVGIPLALYGVLMYSWITPSIINIGLSSMLMVVISLPFIWISLTAESKELLNRKVFSKLPLTRNVVTTSD